VHISSASKDRNLLVLNVSSDRDPGAWYLFDRGARKASALARSYPAIDPARQASTRPFVLTARDGLELHGLLTLPPGSAGKKLPLVVMPHGGPYWVRDVWGYDPELQILGQHGYAVLQLNFRGSGGYGLQFIEKGLRQWGRAMQDDLSDATRWAISQGVADPGRICIYGASYGGYAALMGPIREPGLYRCAASFAGPTNLETMFKWGSIRNGKLGKRYLDRALGTDKAELAARSPARHAAEIGVPVLLAHGYRDARVDVRHAHDMKSQLSKRNQPVEYVEYPETGHGLAIEKHRLDFYARLLRFLDRNIGPAAARAPGAVASRDAVTQAGATPRPE
jgi:dipeptidyl aminopeptidase/acylaminoacyl peptidase